MAGYPSLTDIEVKWRTSGSGVCLIVEGETNLDDPWFYQQWFGSEARRFTFFAQDGWVKVQEAVAALRITLGSKKVYGIIDRDFEPTVTYPPVPANGIVRTQRYTLENYLLNEECWFKYVQPHTQRMPKPGWSTLEETRTTLLNLYRRCLPLSAYNWTLREARQLNEAAFKALPVNDQQYREHPKAIENVDVSAHLTRLQAAMGLAEDLPPMYQARLAQLQTMTPDEWAELVSGKYVLKVLKETFPLRLGSDKAWDDVLAAYTFICRAPPDDLVTLLEIIWQDAHP
jgi:hypothetical protein